jgi:hypothetical protein
MYRDWRPSPEDIASRREAEEIERREWRERWVREDIAREKRIAREEREKLAAENLSREQEAFLIKSSSLLDKIATEFENNIGPLVSGDGGKVVILTNRVSRQARVFGLIEKSRDDALFLLTEVRTSCFLYTALISWVYGGFSSQINTRKIHAL